MPRSESSTLSTAEAREVLADLPSIVDARTASTTLGISDRTLRRWIAAGRLRALRTSAHNGGRIRVAKSALVDLLVSMSA